MNTIVLILLFLLYIKLFLFWLWVWQIKMYHLGRFLAHFEEQKFKKIISSFWRPKYPKFTPKIIVIFLTGLILGCFMILKGFYLYVFFLIIIIPLFFQIPTVILRNRVLKKAKQKRERFKDLLVVGITGSYGKTSTKEFLATILTEKLGKDKILKTKEHQNSEIGISRCILNNLNEKHQIFVVEMGAYNKGGIKLLCDIIKPKIGIITGVNEQHLATFGSMENLLSAEGGKELVDALPENGLIIFNGNNKYCRETYKKTKKPKKISFSHSPFFPAAKKIFSPDIWAEEIKIEKEKLFFKVFSKDGEKADFEVNLLGAQNVENILLAACCAKESGMNLSEISGACRKLKSFPRQMELKKGINGLNIIDASYSANPDGVTAHLDYLKIWPGRKVIVMPCLIELGSSSKEAHKKIGEKIAEVCDLAIITTRDRFEEIKKEAGNKAILLEKPEEIFKKIKDFSDPGDVILLESRVPNKLLKELI